MLCDICGKDKPWVELVGKDFVCHSCIQQHSPFCGKIMRTHMDSFLRILKKKAPKDFEELKGYTKEDVKDVINVSKALNLKY